MAEVGFMKLVSHDSVYRRLDVWLLLYVDDIITIQASGKNLRDVKTELMRFFDVQDLCILKSFLDVLSQQQYITKELEKFSMQVCKPVFTPATSGFVVETSEKGLCDRSKYQELLGCIPFISKRTLLDISLSASLLCR